MNTGKPVIKYKKAPQAPKRFKSSYIFFSTVKHKELRIELIANTKEEGGKIRTTDVAKLVSKVWKALPEEEREKWEELAKQDRIRYEKEKLAYTGPWKVPIFSKRQQQPKQTRYKIHKPQRPLSAFLSFSNAKRWYVTNTYPEAITAEIPSILAQLWRDAPPHEKQLFLNAQFRLEQQYTQTMFAWETSRNSSNTNNSAAAAATRTTTSNTPMSITTTSSSMGNTSNSSAYCTDMAATIFDDFSPHSTLSTCMNSNTASAVAGAVAVAGPTASSTAYHGGYGPYHQEQRQYQYQQHQHQQPQHYPHYDPAAAAYNNYRNPYGDTHPSSYGYQLPPTSLSSTITNAANHTSYDERGYANRESQAQHAYGYSVQAHVPPAPPRTNNKVLETNNVWIDGLPPKQSDSTTTVPPTTSPVQLPDDHPQPQKPVSVTLEYPQQHQELQQQQPSSKQNDVSASIGGNNNNNNETPYYPSYSCDLNSSFPPDWTHKEGE